MTFAVLDFVAEILGEDWKKGRHVIEWESLFSMTYHCRIGPLLMTPQHATENSYATGTNFMVKLVKTLIISHIMHKTLSDLLRL